MISWIQLLCSRWIVYSWRQSTVTDGRCKYNTQMTCFRSAKVCTKWIQEKWRSTHTAWQQIGTGNKLQVEIGIKSGHWPRMRGDNAWRGHQWQRVHNCPWLRGDTARCVHQWQLDHFHRLPHCLSVSAHFLVLSCLYIVTCTRTVVQVMSLSHHPHVHVHVSVSPRFALFFFLLLALLAALVPLPLALEFRRLQAAANSAQRGYGLVWRVLPPHTSSTSFSWSWSSPSMWVG